MPQGTFVKRSRVLTIDFLAGATLDAEESRDVVVVNTAALQLAS
jgi:hypothetical protein